MALLQLAQRNRGWIYIDCKRVDDVEELDRIYFETDNATLLLDDIHKLPESCQWIKYLNLKASECPGFRIVAASAVAGHTLALSNMEMEGKVDYIRMPIITYLEYLYMTNAISSYDADLRKVNYADSFNSYMDMKGLESMRIGPLDMQGLQSDALDVEIANRSIRFVTTYLRADTDAVFAAYVLLALKLLENRKQKTAMQLRNANERLYRLASAIMPDALIVKALKYLMLSELGMYDGLAQGLSEWSRRGMPYLGESDARAFFAQGTFDAVNPLLCSAISKELWQLIRGYAAMHGEDQSLDWPESPSPSSSIERSVWAETYIRGAIALMGKQVPLSIRSYQDTCKNELGIISASASPDTLFSFDISQGIDKKNNFGAINAGSQKCVIATRQECTVEDRDGIRILKLPYSMLAAYLDRGETPDPGDFMQCFT
jgi:hypothetical protein